MNLQETHTHMQIWFPTFVWISVAKAHHLVRWSINKNLMLSLILPKSKKKQKKGNTSSARKALQKPPDLKNITWIRWTTFVQPKQSRGEETWHWLTIEDAFTASGCVLLCYELAAGYAEPQGSGREFWMKQTLPRNPSIWHFSMKVEVNLQNLKVGIEKNTLL